MSSKIIQRMFRTSNNTWMYYSKNKLGKIKKVSIQVPNNTDYKLAWMTRSIIGKLKSKQSVNDLKVKLSSTQSKYKGNWKILKKQESWMEYFWRLTAFTSPIKDPNLTEVQVLPDSTVYSSEQMNKSDYFEVKKPFSTPILSLSYTTKVSVKDRINASPFTDPFTKLASKAFQTVSKNFISENKIAGEWRYVLTKNVLQLKKLSKKDTKVEKKENAHVIKTFKKFIVQEYGIEHVRDLPPKTLNQIVEVLVTSEKDFDKIFTGRKIEHLAIAGYKTMGNKKFRDSSRDLHELLQSFPDFRDSHNCSVKGHPYFRFFELLSHILMKKHPISIYQDPLKKGQSLWRAGLLIPGPNKTYYTVNSCVDDGHGDFNFIVEPLSQKYIFNKRGLPCIKLYRSTSSDKSNVSSQLSISADFNYNGSPGSTNPKMADNFELPELRKRMIPIWVSYLLLAEKLKLDKKSSKEKVYKALQNSLKLYKKFVKKPDKVKALSKGSLDQKIKYLQDILVKIANKAKELPKYKTEQDLVFNGHSLGGSLAQRGMVDLTISSGGYVPLPGCKLLCQALATPATDLSVSIEFIEFGRRHKSLFKQLGNSVGILFGMEYGDIVPQSGDCHLAVPFYDSKKDKDWLKIDTLVFKPNKVSTSLELTTMPTHGRRFGKTKDYKITKLTPKQLHEFDTSWWLSEELQAIFGLKILLSPKILEGLRIMASAITYPPRYIENVFNEPLSEMKCRQIKDSVFYAQYERIDYKQKSFIG